MKKIIVSILSLISLFVLSTVACAFNPASDDQKLKRGSDGRIIIVESTNPANRHPLREAFESYLEKSIALEKSGYYGIGYKN